MRYLSHSKPQQNSGFTLVEMLVIAPIALLMIGGFIALMVSMVSNVMVTKDQNKIIYEAQDSLNRIEQDTRLAISFLTTSGPLASPQGSNDATAPFTNSTANTLVIQSLATTKNPADSARQIVYYADQPNPCGISQTANQLFVTTIVYFVKNGSLWRRSIVPDGPSVCGSIWQLNSCSTDYSNARCKVNDSEVMQNIDSMSVQYYSSPAATIPIAASSATSASTIKVTIAGKKTTAGRDVSTSQAIITTKLNDTPSNIGPLPLAVNQQPSSQSVLVTAKNVTFTSSSNYSSASKQWQKSTNNGASWSNISGATGSSHVLGTVNLGLDGSQYRMVATDGTQSATSQPATLNVSLWEDLQLYESWSAYSPTFASPAYTITSTGEVFLKGMIGGGNNAYGTVIAILPPEARPDKRLIFHIGTYDVSADGGSGIARVDVLPNGEVSLQSASSTWTSLDSVNFMPSGACTFTNLSLSNGWTNYNSASGTYPQLSVCKDSISKVHVQGLLKPGTLTPGTIIGALPTSFRPDQNYLVPGSRSTSTSSFGSFGSYSNAIVSRGATSGAPFLAVNHTYFTSAYSSWTNASLTNGWVAYGSSFTSPQYTKSSDGVVTLKGLIKSGTTSNGTTIMTLPAGYRPATKLLLNGLAGDAHTRLDVGPDGKVVIWGGALSNFLSLDDIVFIAEQ